MAIRFGHVNKALTIIEMLLAAILIAMLAKFTWGFLKPSSVAMPAQNIAASMDTNTPAQTIDSSILTRFDPFHRSQKSTVKKPAATSAPETTLDLKVFGMRADLAGDSSSAIIQTPDKKQAIYFLDDEIIPGVFLKSVDIDFVILDRNGTMERLSRQGRTKNDTGKSSAAMVSGLSFKAASMFNDVHLYPYREGRTMIGYKVTPRRGGGTTLEEYGFKRDDIVTAINGEDLTQPRINMPNLIKTIKLSRFASIQIIRDDVPMTLEVTLQ